MAGRCGCSSSNATGASISAGACVTVTGAGTTASPAVIGVEIDPSSANTLECGTDGLFAASAQVEAADESVTVTGDGSNATPYEVAAQISELAGNSLSLEDDGLYGGRNPDVLAGSSALFGGAVPADPNWVIESGNYVATTNVAGHIVVPIFVDLLGILSIVYSLNDVPGSVVVHAIDNSTVALDHFDVVFQDTAGAPVAFGTFRINYTVIGWYAT